MQKNPLEKLNKLKRYAIGISEKMAESIENEVSRVDCLNNNDIYTQRDLWEKLDNIAKCASLVEIRSYETGESKIHNANFCHNPIVCPVCADRVSKRRRALFAEPIKRAVRRFGVSPETGDWRSEWPRGYTGVYMATATIQDGPDLKNRIDALIDSIKRFRKMGQKRRRRHSLGEWRKVRAGISNIEIKTGTGSGRWHVHAHFLIFTDEPLDTRLTDSPYFIQRKQDGRFGTYNPKENGEKIQLSKFSYEWFEANGGIGINFDVTPVQFKRYVNKTKCETFEESVVYQAQEILKYNTILSTKKGTRLLTAFKYVELIQRRGNRRLFNPIGLMRCDKRNPDSLMTLTEREVRRLEYVEKMDGKTYEIYASLWQHGGTYSTPAKQEAALFSSSDDLHTKFINIRRRAFMVQAAKYQGEYRKERHALFRTRYMHVNKEYFENLLDECRDIFRRRISRLWQHFGDMDFLPEFLCDFNSDGLAGFKSLHLNHSPG